MSTSENIWQLDNVAVGTETYFFQFQAAMGTKGFFSRVRRLRRDASGEAVDRHIFGPRPKLRVTINTRSKPRKTGMESLWHPGQFRTCTGSELELYANNNMITHRPRQFKFYFI